MGGVRPRGFLGLFVKPWAREQIADVGMGQGYLRPIPWPRRDRDGLGRVLPRSAKKLIITLKVIIKVINILSIILFRFSVVAALEPGTIGKGRDGL